jgi:hypothetical protein
LSGFLLTLSVAAFTIGVLAPILEAGLSPDGRFSLLRSVAAGFGGLVLAAAGLYLAGASQPRGGGQDDGRP